MKHLSIFVLCCLLASTSYAQKVEYSFTATKVGATAPATSFHVNDEIDVVLYVRDLRPTGTWQGTKLVNGMPVTKTWPLVRGVFAAYADVSFDDTVLKLESTSFNPNYPNGIRFTANDGFFDDVGAFSGSIAGLGTDKRELMRWRFRCAWGDTSLDCYFAHIQRPQCDTLVYGNDNANPPEKSLVEASEIRAVSLSISVR